MDVAKPNGLPTSSGSLAANDQAVITVTAIKNARIGCMRNSPKAARVCRDRPVINDTKSSINTAASPAIPALNAP